MGHAKCQSSHNCSFHLKGTKVNFLKQWSQIQIGAQCENESNATKTPHKVGILELTDVPVQVLPNEALEVHEVDICAIKYLLHGVLPRQFSVHVPDTCLHVILPAQGCALDGNDRLTPNGLRLDSNEKPHSQSIAMNSCIEIHQQHSQSRSVFQAKLQWELHRGSERRHLYGASRLCS